MNALARIAQEIAAARKPAVERAYDALREAAKHGHALDISDHDLVGAVSMAVFNHEPITAQYGLNELQTRTSADALRAVERRTAA